jgi:hypothetical protein
MKHRVSFDHLPEPPSSAERRARFGKYAHRPKCLHDQSPVYDVILQYDVCPDCLRPATQVRLKT